jgi:hypothetical protein
MNRAMSKKKPTAFVGSSAESIPVMDTVVRLLKPYAQVTKWTDGDKFRKIGHYFLDSLIDASGQFDFAILVFGPDDIVRSRKKIQPAPRDNVVFELGLFLSKLKRERTFVIAPTLWKSGLKILTDLSGLNIPEYDVPEKEDDLEKNLKGICRSIGVQMREIGARQESRGPKDVSGVHPQLEDLIRTARSLNKRKRARVRNIALDMEVTWHLVRDKILQYQEAENISWQTLMIDHKAEVIRKHKSGTVSVSVARDVEEKIGELCSRCAPELARRNIKFECRAYSHLPILHGFMFNEDVLLFSLCGIEEGKLVGAPNPYIRLGDTHHAGDDATPHFLSAFNSWFEYYWTHSRVIWPPEDAT